MPVTKISGTQLAKLLYLLYVISISLESRKNRWCFEQSFYLTASHWIRRSCSCRNRYLRNISQLALYVTEFLILAFQTKISFSKIQISRDLSVSWLQVYHKSSSLWWKAAGNACQISEKAKSRYYFVTVRTRNIDLTGKEVRALQKGIFFVHSNFNLASVNNLLFSLVSDWSYVLTFNMHVLLLRLNSFEQPFVMSIL